MPLEQTITIVNNSGKIISTGKQLLSVFKEAKGAYQEKKAEIKSEKSTLHRAQTFDHHPSRSLYRSYDPHDHDNYYEEDDDYYYKYEDDGRSRRRSVYAPSEASSRRTARRSRSTHSKRHRERDHDHRSSATPRRPALTESNLKTLSEVSSEAPSRPRGNYRSPYVETVTRDMAVSKMDLTHAEMRSLAATERRPPTTAMSRRRSFTELGPQRRHSYDHQAHAPQHAADLDPAQQEANKEKRAKALVKKVELLMDEAKCARHSTTHTIQHLQKNPDAAAAVALTLAELSTLVTKMSPAFLGFLKGGSPAVFALLASPQFLIGTAAVVGVTVVMFGGWKIVKKVKEDKAAREALAYEGVPMNRPAPMRTQSEFSTGMDEALVLDEELSTIESWRRGIIPEFGDNESADMELMTPEAERARRARKGKDDDFDLKSRKSTRTTKTSKTKREVPERKSSKLATAESVAGSERSRKTSKKKEKTSVRAIEDGRSRRGENDDIEMAIRPKGHRQDNMLKALFKNKKEKERELVRV